MSLRHPLIGLALALSTVLCSPSVWAMERGAPSAAHDSHQHEQAEVALLDVLNSLLSGQYQQALPKAKALRERYPNFQLAQLIYADLLSSATGSPTRVLQPDGSKALLALRNELHRRYLGRTQPPGEGARPDVLMRLSSRSPYVVAVDFSKSRQYVFKNHNNQLTLVAENYISIGKEGYDKFVEGDNRTPIGVYFTKRFLRDSELPELYGAGAFPTDYPNAIDRYHKKTGYGIWLHGVPRTTHSRPPLTSEGCVVMSNDRLLNLKHILPERSIPVVFSKQLHWRAPGEANPLLEPLEHALEQWRSDWESRDAERFLSHYSDDFRPQKGSLYQWQKRKRQLARTRSTIRVQIRNLELYRYPDSQQTQGLVLARFTQHYRGDQYRDVSEKKQYWQRQADGSWRILLEKSR